MHGGLHGGVVLAHAAGAHLVHLGLRHVDHILRLRAFGVIAELRDLCTRGDHAAQQRALVHNLRIIRGVRSRGHGGDERMQVVDATDLVEVSGVAQPVGHGDGVRGLGCGELANDRLVDRLVLRLIEVIHRNDLRNLANGVLAHEHTAKRRHLGVVVVRGDAVEETSGIGAGVGASVVVESVSHSSRL